MKNQLMIVVVILQAFAFAARAEDWRPASYEKIVLPPNTPEGIVFFENENAGSSIYSLAYFIDEKIIVTRVLPRELYEMYHSEFQQSVLSLSAKDQGQACKDKFTLISAKFKEPPKIISYCLSSRGSERNSRANFARWFQKIRRQLGLGSIAR